LTAFVDFFDFDTSNNHPTVNFLKHTRQKNQCKYNRIKKQSHGGLRNKKNKRERHMPSFTLLEREKTVTSKNKQSTLVIVRVTPVKHKSSLDKKNYVYRA
jgi:hypothetical protein